MKYLDALVGNEVEEFDRNNSCISFSLDAKYIKICF